MNNRILLLASHLNYRTGLNTHMRYLYRVLEKAGFRPIYGTMSGSRTTKPGLVKDYHYVEGFDTADAIRIIRLIKPFLVISFNDIWKMRSIRAARLHYPFYWIHHLLTEESSLYKEMIMMDEKEIYTLDLSALADVADLTVPATELSANVAKEWKLSKVLDTVVHPFVDYDRIEFSRKARQKYRSDLKVEANDYLFMAVARNFARKNLPGIFQGFQAFCHATGNLPQLWKEGQSKPLLYVHTLPLSPMGWDTNFLGEKYGIDKRTYIRQVQTYDEEVEDKTMNSLYSAADCVVSIAHAEGLGYPVIEAMLTGCHALVGSGGYPHYFADTEDCVTVEKIMDFIPYGSGFSQVWHMYHPKAVAGAMAAMFQKRPTRSKLNPRRIRKYFNDSKQEAAWVALAKRYQEEYSRRGVKS